MDIRAAIYARLSSNRDGAKDATLEYQEQRGHEIAETEGFKVVDVLTDSDLSGTKNDRPGYLKLVSLIESGDVDVVLTQAMDRIGRDAEERLRFAGLCRSHDVLVRTWDGLIDLDSPEGQLTHGIQATVDQWYANVVSKKQKEAHKRRVQEGRVNGYGKMFGEQDGEPAIVEEMVNRVLKGHSMLSVVRWLNDSGIKTRRGNDWTATGLRILLSNPRLAGVLVSKGKEVGMISHYLDDNGEKVPYRPILDSDTFEELQIVMDSKARKPKRGRPTRLLTPYMVCSGCGNGMTVASNQRYSYYRCNPAYKCDNRQTVTADKTDEYVFMHSLQRLFYQKQAKEPENGPEPKREEYMAELRKLSERKEALGEDYAEGLISRSTMLAGSKKLEAKIEELRAHVPAQTLEDRLAQARKDVEAGKPVSIDAKKRAVSAVLDKVVALPVRRSPALGFDYGRLEIHWLEDDHQGQSSLPSE